MHLIERGFNESIWLLIPFLILLIVIAVENQKKTKFYYLTIKGVVDFQFFKITYKTEEANKSKLDLVVISSLSIIGLFIKSTGIIDLSSGQHILTECALIILLVITYYFLKAILVKVSGYLFNKKQLFSVYLAYYNSFIKATAIIAIPFLAFNIIYFSKSIDSELFFYFNFTLIFIVSILYIFRIYHLAIKGVGNKISYFNIFLYLCTLEISPFIFIYCYFGEY